MSSSFNPFKSSPAPEGGAPGAPTDAQAAPTSGAPAVPFAVAVPEDTGGMPLSGEQQPRGSLLDRSADQCRTCRTWIKALFRTLGHTRPITALVACVPPVMCLILLIGISSPQDQLARDLGLDWRSGLDWRCMRCVHLEVGQGYEAAKRGRDVRRGPGRAQGRLPPPHPPRSIANGNSLSSAVGVVLGFTMLAAAAGLLAILHVSQRAGEGRAPHCSRHGGCRVICFLPSPSFPANAQRSGASNFCV